MAITHKVDVENLEKSIRLVRMERMRQEDRFGQQNHPDGTGLEGDLMASARARETCEESVKQGYLTYREILDEEVKEAFAETDKKKLKEELVQVAAVALAWVEKLLREEQSAT